MNKRGDRRRVLTSEERVLWKAFTKAIEPLRAPQLDQADTADVPLVPLLAEPKPRGVARAPKEAASAPRTPALAPLDRRTKQRLARGSVSIDGKLDLHGMTQDEAHGALLRFLRNASARGKKVVLVITGKGTRGDSERGVLRRQVPQWLSLPEFRPFVIGFEQAHARHGGEGSLYVRVRRARG